MTRFLYDTAVFVYALGGEHRYREPCRAILERARRGELRGEASADMLQELAHHRLRRTGDHVEAARVARAAGALCDLHDVRVSDVRRGLDLLADASRLGARDAIFAALALERGIEVILTSDRAFEEVGGLVRADPTDAQAVSALAG